MPCSLALAGVLLLGSAAATAAPTSCSGDCNRDGSVRVQELVTLVNISLGQLDISVCVAGEVQADGMITIDELVVAVNRALSGCDGASQCAGTTYTYTFTNYCDQQIYIGQNGPGSASTPPSFPTTTNWSVAAACTVANQASVCAGANTCQVADGQTLGQCTCAQDSDCSGSPCVGGLCSTAITFCMPQDWSSGVFWPRTGCTLSNSGTDLTCNTGQCGGDPAALTGGAVDCGSGSMQTGPTAPAIRFEPTTTSGGSLNYDVSVINGFNVEMSVDVIGGGDACPTAGCVGDLIAACPSNLVFGNPNQVQPGVTPTPVGCYQPQDACNSAGAGPQQTPPAGLNCADAITVDSLGNAPVATTDCAGNNGGDVTYLDMYEAENTADSMTNTQASTNSGQITAFDAADCPPGTEFATAFVQSGSCSTTPPVTPCPTGQTCTDGTCGVAAPTGTGVCLQFVSGILVPDYGCNADNIGTACGQYVTAGLADGLGYTCQAVTYSGGTAYPCLPSTLSGLGTCEINGSEGFYPGVGGPFNPSWVQAGIQAGGGTTPYYQTFKTVCPYAYSFQYDDKSSDYGCSITASSTNGFAITFCGSALTPTGSTPTPTPTPPAPQATATGTGTATPTAPEATATSTPTQPQATVTNTATATSQAATPTPTLGSGSLTWLQAGEMSSNISISIFGMSYTGSALILNDSDNRFCTTAGMQPIVTVVLSDTDAPTIGAVTTSSSQLTIANIPAAINAGTYDVKILLFEKCGSTQTTLTMSQAITYQSSSLVGQH